MPTKEFVSSRLSVGNRVTPDKIVVSDFGISIVDNGLFKDRAEDINFSQISAVSVETPLIGYSTLLITYGDDDVTVRCHGYTEADATEMRGLIQAGMAKATWGRGKDMNG